MFLTLNNTECSQMILLTSTFFSVPFFLMLVSLHKVMLRVILAALAVNIASCVTHRDFFIKRNFLNVTVSRKLPIVLTETTGSCFITSPLLTVRLHLTTRFSLRFEFITLSVGGKSRILSCCRWFPNACTSFTFTTTSYNKQNGLSIYCRAPSLHVTNIKLTCQSCSMQAYQYHSNGRKN
jgi:hypothetical protein